jgi:acetolactate synthase-1/2/3 large subunit
MAAVVNRPIILLGHGIRAAAAAHLAPRLLELGVPIIASWQAKDLVDNDHPMFMGCPGIYGTRAANKALAEATEILAIGNRLAIWNVGYEGIRPDQSLIIVSLDKPEARRYPNATWIREDCKSFLERSVIPLPDEIEKWRSTCAAWKVLYAIPEAGTHDDRDGYINSYRFFDGLNWLLRPAEQITIDCGAACASAFQALRVRPPQRIYSSGGLGEMGCALPAAVGVSLATGKREVICIVGDGALMMNLQELQTIVHHNLPVKIIVAVNDGYLMLKHTQTNAGMAHAGVSAASGVSCPDFRRLAAAFGITAAEVRDWDDYHRVVRACLYSEGPALIEYRMHPQQPCVPKLGYDWVDGKNKYARFDDMSPRLEIANAR